MCLLSGSISAAFDAVVIATGVDNSYEAAGADRPTVMSTLPRSNTGRSLFELIRILLCHDGGTRINERRYNLAFNHLDERVDAQLPDLLWELRD